MFITAPFHSGVSLFLVFNFSNYRIIFLEVFYPINLYLLTLPLVRLGNILITVCLSVNTMLSFSCPCSYRDRFYGSM